MPELQKSFTLFNGHVVRVDFWWPDSNIVGEFDGFTKYRRELLRPGENPEDAVIREKRRQDMLEALDLRVVRWSWDELRDPDKLRHLLSAKRVPLARSSHHSGIA